MTNTNLLQAMGRIDLRLIADAAPDVSQKKGTKKVWIKWCALAACVCLVVGLGWNCQEKCSRKTHKTDAQ